MDTLIALWQRLVESASAFAVNAEIAGGAANAASTLSMPQLLALAAAMGWASGLRLYLVLFIVGSAGALDWIALPAGLHLLQHPALLAASGFMMCVEFFADKIPGLDSLWDVVHSVIRIPAGAALAAGIFGADSAVMGVVAGLLGGTLSATSFATKASTRAAVNTSPEPFSNVAVSFVEDGAVIGAIWLATHHPVIFGLALALTLLLSVWVLILLARFLRAVIRRVLGFFGGSASLELAQTRAQPVSPPPTR